MVNLAYTVENSSNSSKDLFSKRDFVLHAENLDLIYYRAAAIALIKAKTASVLREFPSKAEAILFAQCQDSAPTPTTLAKCAVSVFKARDNYRSHLASHQEHSNVDEDFGDSMRDGDSWISTIVRKMLAKPAETVKKHFVKWLDTIRADAKLQKEKGNTLANMSNISMSKSAEKESDIKVTGKQEPVLHEPSRQTSAEVQKASKEGPNADENNTSEELLITSISEEPFNESKDQNNSTNLESLPKNIRKNFLLFHKYTHPRRKSANKTEFRLQKLLKRIKKMIIRQRRRRSVENPNDEGKRVNLPQTNTFNLKKLQKFYARVAEITNHMKIMGENNFDFLNTFGQMTRIFPSSFKFHHQMDNAESNPLLRKAENRLNQYLPEPVEILSPKVFTLFPEKGVFSQSAEHKNETSENDKTKRILSPTVLSFQKQGLLSMPSLLSFLPVEEQFNWLELLLECSGAGRLLERLLKLLGPRKFKEVEETIFPIIQK
ncbi:CRE-MLTN-13 protein [Ditylenchus destructor]|nr:CRE-MLTN-13 protein [Ditylenchus destructor]